MASNKKRRISPDVRATIATDYTVDEPGIERLNLDSSQAFRDHRSDGPVTKSSENWYKEPVFREENGVLTRVYPKYRKYQPTRVVDIGQAPVGAKSKPRMVIQGIWVDVKPSDDNVEYCEQVEPGLYYTEVYRRHHSSSWGDLGPSSRPVRKGKINTRYKDDHVQRDLTIARKANVKKERTRVNVLRTACRMASEGLDQALEAIEYIARRDVEPNAKLRRVCSRYGIVVA